MQITRRECLKLMSTAAFAATVSVPLPLRATPTPESLRDAAAKRGLRYGSNSDFDFAQTSATYRALFAQQCGLFAPNIWSATISLAENLYQFDKGQENMEFALSNKQALTGAHLLWNQSVPGWMKTITGQAAMTKALVEMVYKIAVHYADQAFSWNVINEALNPVEGRPDGLRRWEVLEQAGPDYIDFAFRAARRADPKALLAWNEYGMELDTPDNEARRSALLRFLDRLQKQGAPIDAVGLQSHLKLAEFTFSETRFRRFLHEIASRGLKILITELDVLEIGAPADFSRRDRMVADVYSRYLDVALDEPAVKSVVTWGLSDRYTWLTPKYDPKFARPDGLSTRPLPFDADFKPTAVYAAMLNALNSAPVRQIVS